jgi:ribonuclease BN (tRNA processing enzyme)
LPDVELFQRLRARWISGAETTAPGEIQHVPEEDRSALEFIRDSDVLIVDSQYTPGEYEQHGGWGHSCFEDAVTFATLGGVRHLFLFHHDPDHTDEQISNMVGRARELAIARHSSLTVDAAREGLQLMLPAAVAQ